MILVLHYSIVCRACSEFSGKMAQTAEQLALLSYSQVYDDSSHILRGALSDSYAHSQVISKAQDKDSVKNASFLLSSFLKEDSKISLVLTYQVKSPVSIISPPWTIFLQKMTIRGWTGKDGVPGEREGSSEDSGQGKEVYVTDSGSVYHTDPNCTHLKLTIESIPRSKLKTVRNYSGSKYKRCKYCGSMYPDSASVLVDPYGDTYHTSASCQGLKRTVNSVHLDDVSGMRECRDCARRRKQSTS